MAVRLHPAIPQARFLRAVTRTRELSETYDESDLDPCLRPCGLLK